MGSPTLKRSLSGAASLAFSLTILIVVMTTSRPVIAQNPPIFSITVEATGTAVGLPDRASLEFGVEVVATDLQNAIDEVNQKIDAISQALGELEITQRDIQNISLEITSEDLRDPSTGSITGELLFHVRSPLHVIVQDVTKVQTVIRTAVLNGATTIGNLTLGIDNLELLEQQARQAAIANAYERAEALAFGFNLSLGDPIIVTETIANDGLPVPFSGSDLQRSALDSDSLPASPSSLIMTVNILVVFRTQPQSSDFTTLPPEPGAPLD